MSENFKESLLKLDHYATYYKNDKRYILLFTYVAQSSIPTVLLRVYNEDAIWIHQIQQEQIDNMRAKSDIKGTSVSFIEMLKLSLDNNQFSLILSGAEQNLNILFEFKLTQGVFIKINLELGGGLLIKDEDSKQVQNDFIFDLYDSMKMRFIELKNNKELELKSFQQSNVVSKEKDMVKGLPQQEEIKAEPHKKKN